MLALTRIYTIKKPKGSGYTALDEKERYIKLSLTVASELLKNGGETYRAEDCVKMILKSAGSVDTQVFATPTNVLVTAQFADAVITRSRSVRGQTTDLDRIDSLNTVSRALSAGTVTLSEAENMIEKCTEKKNSFILSCLFSSLNAAFFSLIFGGGVLEFIFGMAIAFTSHFLIKLIKKVGNYNFIFNMICAIFTATIARGAQILIPDLNIAAIIIGGIMPLLPGLAMTNAVRDTINGDLVSGAARTVEALLSAITVAAGVGIVLSI